MSNLKLEYIREPNLAFGFDQAAFDPRDGLMLFGPFDRQSHKGSISVGIIGPQMQREFLIEYLHRIHAVIHSAEPEIARPFFPGFEATFGSGINLSDIALIDVPYAEIETYLRYADKHQRVFNLVNLFADALIKFHNEEEKRPDVWFIAIPEVISQHCRPRSPVLNVGTKIYDGIPKKERSKGWGYLFEEDTKKAEAYHYEVNFHNQLKAKLLPHRIVSQIIRDSKIAYEKLWVNQQKIDAEKKLDSAKAWNISSALYYKSGGLPWKLSEIRQRVCYLGLVYKKLDQSADVRNACCAAQMFLDSGDGMVFRGNIGPWYNPETKEFHLSATDATEIVQKSIQSYVSKDSGGNPPDEIFIHSKTHFNEDEWRGFTEAASGRSKLIGIRVRDERSIKLYREFTYAIPRGTVLILNRRRAYLWTKGYIPRLQTQLGLETPNPLSIEITRGDADIRQVCKDILALTKLNYNSCLFGDGLPVTLRFADAIGEILTAGPLPNVEILPFKNYI